LGISLAAASRLITLRLVAGLTAPFLGPLADRYGRRRVILAAVGLFILAGLLLAGLGTLWAVALAFVLYGLAKILFDPAVQAYLGDTVPYQERGRAIGIVELSWSSSWLLGVPLSGFLIERWGWRAPWMGLTVFGALSLWLILVRLQPSSSCSVYDREVSFIGGTLRAWRDLLRRPLIARFLLVGLLLNLAIEVPFVIYGAWLEDAFGLGLSTLGVASIAVGLAEATAEFGTMVFTDRLGKRRSVLLGLLGLALSLLGLPWMAGRGVVVALAGVVVVMLTFEFSLVSFLPLASEVAPQARASLISLVVTAFSLGRIVGTTVGGWLWGWGTITLHALFGAACALAAAGFLYGLRDLETQGLEDEGRVDERS
jgi:predicted MFS family arabinose efflux permease